jgi:hypothetical protein
MYYDSVKQYNKLQELKDKVDPENLFDSLMTVKPTSIPIQPIQPIKSWFIKQIIKL